MGITNIKRKCRHCMCVCGKFFDCPAPFGWRWPKDLSAGKKTRRMTQRPGNKSAQITITKGNIFYTGYCCCSFVKLSSLSQDNNKEFTCRCRCYCLWQVRQLDSYSASRSVTCRWCRHIVYIASRGGATPIQLLVRHLGSNIYIFI